MAGVKNVGAAVLALQRLNDAYERLSHLCVDGAARCSDLRHRIIMTIHEAFRRSVARGRSHSLHRESQQTARGQIGSTHGRLRHFFKVESVDIFVTVEFVPLDADGPLWVVQVAQSLHQEVVLLSGALAVVDRPLLVARLKGRLDRIPRGARGGLYNVFTCFELAESACESVAMTVQRRVKERATLTSQSLESGKAFITVVQDL